METHLAHSDPSSDIAFYGVNLNQSIVLSKIGYGKAATPWGTLWNTAVGNVIVECAVRTFFPQSPSYKLTCFQGYLPGYYIGIFLPDLVGRVRQQFYLSALVAVIYAIWAGVSNHTSKGGLVTLFTLSQLVLNAGPNCTTFLIPVEVFPTRVRATAHGIAAASGKLGACVTAFAFGSLTDAIGLRSVLGLLSVIMALVSVFTLLIPETKGRSLDEIERSVMYDKNYNGAESVPSSATVSPELEGKTNVLTKDADGRDISV
jgi:PHS family inorganic phosphate transporter-like MFS transporter